MILENMNKQKLFLLVIMVFMFGCTKAKHVPAWEHFWAPNSFTPNGDGLNESFSPIPHADVLFTDYHIIIFDENLQRLYESKDKDGYWDPTQLNQNLPTGFYEYQITYTCSVDSVNYYDYITHSTVNLIR
jgi:gliding motility-associated-like protein